MRGDDKISERSEESLLSFQAIDGRLVKECYQGFLSPLASSAVTPYCLVALASGQTAKHWRSVRNDMRGRFSKSNRGCGLTNNYSKRDLRDLLARGGGLPVQLISPRSSALLINEPHNA